MTTTHDATPVSPTEVPAPRHETGLVHTSEMGAQVARSGTRASEALAERARAIIQARHVMAVQNPRVYEKVRAKILRECQRPAFAEQARYSIKNKGDGWTIRFAEAVGRSMGHIAASSVVTHDDEHTRIVHCEVTDYESCTSYEHDAIIEKTIERRHLGRGEIALSERVNSYGDKVYTRRATADEVLVKQNSEVSKTIRTLMLRLIPGDLLEECHAAVNETKHTDAAKNPHEARKRLREAFTRLNVPSTELRAYVGKDLEELTPADISELRELYTAINDGQVTWAEVVAEKAEGGNDTSKSAKTDALAERLKKTAKKEESA